MFILSLCWICVICLTGGVVDTLSQSSCRVTCIKSSYLHSLSPQITSRCSSTKFSGVSFEGSKSLCVLIHFRLKLLIDFQIQFNCNCKCDSIVLLDCITVLKDLNFCVLIRFCLKMLINFQFRFQSCKNEIKCLDINLCSLLNNYNYHGSTVVTITKLWSICIYCAL